MVSCLLGKLSREATKIEHIIKNKVIQKMEYSKSVNEKKVDLLN